MMMVMMRAASALALQSLGLNLVVCGFAGLRTLHVARGVLPGLVYTPYHFQ